MSKVVDFEMLKDADYAFQRRHGAKEARELLRAHGGATTIDSVLLTVRYRKPVAT